MAVNCHQHGVNFTEECPFCQLGDGDQVVESDGGPSTYYDLPQGVKTWNDVLEWLAVKRWGAYSLHMKDLMKGGFRFGAKAGTSLEYDTKKLIYSGCRLLVMVSGKDRVRGYLRSLLDDPQFQ